MMKISSLIVFCGLLFALASGCASKGKNLFVLIPDPDGNVGEIQLTNDEGTQNVSEAEQAVYVKDSQTPPEPPILLDTAEIQKMFEEVLAIEPQTPQKFILYFRSKTTELTVEALRIIPEILRAVEERQSQDISVIGYTDSKGSKSINFQLSLNRALTVRDMLIAEGIPAAAIEVTSYGEGLPLIKTEDNVSEPRNRRVEVTVR